MLDDPTIDKAGTGAERRPRAWRRWRRDRHRWTLVSSSIAAPLLVAACGDGSSGDSSLIVRDSAGIEIVESVAAASTSGAPWRVSTAPILEIGAADGPDPYQLDRVSGVVRLSDGRIAVADGGSRRIRYYDESGRHIVDAGGSGGGPGEFEALSSVVLMPGDSVGGWDPGAKRLSIFDVDGQFGRAVTFDRVAGFSASLQGVFADGSVVISPGQDVQALMGLEPGEYRRTVVYLRFAGDGALVDTVAAAQGPEMVAYREGASFGNRPVLFGRDHHVTLAGDRFYAGDSDAFEIGVSASDGAPLRLIRRPGDPRPVTRAELEEAVRRAAEGQARSRRMLAERTGGELPEPDLADFAHRETYPAFNQLLVDTEDNLWVQAYPPPGTERREWSVFDPDGRWLGTLQTPEGLEIYQIGSDYLLGRWQDELDVHYVRMYRLTKS